MRGYVFNYKIEMATDTQVTCKITALKDKRLNAIL